MDIERYANFLLNSSSALFELDCLEISHAQFTRPFRYVRNKEDGAEVRHENGEFARYVHQSLGISFQSVSNNLDQKLDVTLVDYDDGLMDAVRQIVNGEAPTVQLRKYRSDELSIPVYNSGPLQATQISNDSYGRVTFSAAPPSLNEVATGRLYTLEEFPLLRGTLV